MERGVEAGDVPGARQRTSRDIECGESGRLMERRKRHELAECRAHVVVHADRMRIAAAAVHDAMADERRLAEAGNGFGQCGVVAGRQVALGDHGVLPVEDAKLDAARADVDDEDILSAHGAVAHAQSVISGRSAPVSRVWRRASARASTIACRSTTA